MLPVKTTRADKKPCNLGSRRHAGQPAWPVLVPTKAQQQQRDCKPQVDLTAELDRVPISAQVQKLSGPAGYSSIKQLCIHRPVPQYTRK